MYMGMPGKGRQPPASGRDMWLTQKLLSSLFTRHQLQLLTKYHRYVATATLYCPRATTIPYTLRLLLRRGEVSQKWR